MIKFILFALTAIATAQDTNDWCTECENFVEEFDNLDATTLADEICPLIDYDGICEDIAPYLIDWIQEHVTSTIVCEALCTEDPEKFYMIDNPRPEQEFGNWCDICKDTIQTFDNLDATVIANEICPFLQYNGFCEDIAPYVIDWLQFNIAPDMICNDICATGEDYSQYGDYNEDIDLNVAQDLHHHPFDIPHHETPHVAQDLHHHPFDLPHHETPHVAQDLHHHPFDLPHSSDEPLVESDVTDET